jgi:spermidine/putrescine-binding protein
MSSGSDRRLGRADRTGLKIISWAHYVPAELIAEFRKQTHIQVHRIFGTQQEFCICKPRRR